MGPGGTLLIAVGTRPEAIKLAPVIGELRRRGDVPVRVCATGQHDALALDALSAFGIVPDVQLGAGAAAPTLAAAAADLTEAMGAEIDRSGAAAVMVQGDTTTAFAGALAGFYAQRPVLHVEAGLRTGDNGNPFPEEGHRRAISALARLHFAPTAAARELLIGEGIASADIRQTGNTSIDALMQTGSRLTQDAAFRSAAEGVLPPLRPGKRVMLVTMHRRENHGAAIDALCDSLLRLAAHDDTDIVVPVHPNPVVRQHVERRLAGHAGIRLCPPLSYPAFVHLLSRAHFVLTDSGGVQEEAPALGCPVLVLRAATERTEALDCGNAVLIGTAPDAIYSTARALLEDAGRHARMSEPALPFGDGQASVRIADAVEELLVGRTCARG